MPKTRLVLVLIIAVKSKLAVGGKVFLARGLTSLSPGRGVPSDLLTSQRGTGEGRVPPVAPKAKCSISRCVQRRVSAGMRVHYS